MAAEEGSIHPSLCGPLVVTESRWKQNGDSSPATPASLVDSLSLSEPCRRTFPISLVSQLSLTDEAPQRPVLGLSGPAS